MFRKYLISLQEFWPYYVREHSRSGNRKLHFVGNTNLFVWLFFAAYYQSLLIMVFAVVSSYALAWVGHFFIERNIPATFRYPVKAAICDMVMYYKMWRGEMDMEVQKHTGTL